MFIFKHFHNIIHRDIKAENVFFADEKSVKVGDFGFSTKINNKDDLLSTFCGSPPYAAPELFNDESYRGLYVDYWSLGVLLYFMVTSSMPFKAQTVSALKKLILDGTYDMPEDISNDCCFVIKNLLRKDPEERLNLDDLRESEWLKHETFPKSLPKYKMQNQLQASIPGKCDQDTSCCAILSPDEKEAYKQLKEFGINDSMINDSIDKGSRCNIVGTYRIILHRLINTRFNANEVKNEQEVSNNNGDINSRIASIKSINANEGIKRTKSSKSLTKSWKSIKSIRNLLFDKNSTNNNVIQNGHIENNFVNGKLFFKSKKNERKSKTCCIL